VRRPPYIKAEHWNGAGAAEQGSKRLKLRRAIHATSSWGNNGVGTGLRRGLNGSSTGVETASGSGGALQMLLAPPDAAGPINNSSPSGNGAESMAASRARSLSCVTAQPHLMAPAHLGQHFAEPGALPADGTAGDGGSLQLVRA